MKVSVNLDNDNTLEEELEGFYTEVYEFFQTKETILKTLFNIPDIKLSKINTDFIHDMVEEIREATLDNYISGGSGDLVSIYRLDFLLVTKDVKRVEELLQQEGVTLLKGLNLTNTILRENFNLEGIQTTVHIDTDIDVETRENSAYYLQVQLLKQ